MHITSPLSAIEARRLAQWHMPRLPGEGRSQYRRRVTLQVQKLLALACRPVAVEVA